jgi:hypothetical protein
MGGATCLWFDQEAYDRHLAGLTAPSARSISHVHQAVRGEVLAARGASGEMSMSSGTSIAVLPEADELDKESP